MRFFQQLAQQLKDVWLGTSVAGRFGFVVLTAICVAAIGGVGYWAAQPDYRVILSGLSPEDAGAVTSKLQAQGVPFRLSAGGTTISVPAARAQQARVDLAVAGLPVGGAKGYELLDESPLGVTPFLQHVNYGRAMQAELARTIMQIESVEFARVHIVRPEPTPFVREQKPTTASVVLKLKPGSALNRSTAAGIVALVAGSVEGLTADAVTILDTTGRVLSEPRGDETSAAASTQLEHRREMETYLASKAEEMLAQLLGPGRSIVRVTADINFKRVREKKENIDPDSRVVTREKTSQKKTAAPAASRGPAAGGSAARPAADSGSSGTGTNEEESESTYDFSKTIQDLEQPGGDIERLTVAAMVDLSQGGGDAGDQVAAPITIKDVEEIVKRAVGFKPDRDEIKVTNVKLAGAPADANTQADWLAAQRWESYEKIARHLSLGIAAVVALLLGRMVLKRLQAAAPASEGNASAQADRSRVMEQLATEAERNPEALARLLAAWLDETESRGRAAA